MPPGAAVRSDACVRRMQSRMCGLEAEGAKVSTKYAMSYVQCAMVLMAEQSFDPQVGVKGQAKAVSRPMNVASDCRFGGWVSIL